LKRKNGLHAALDDRTRKVISLRWSNTSRLGSAGRILAVCRQRHASSMRNLDGQILLLFPVAVLGLAEFRAAQNRASIVHGLLRFEACTAPLDSLK
jgi:hypothetical protein